MEPIIGTLSHRWGRKGFLLGGLFIHAVVGVAMPQATSVASLRVIGFLHGALGPGPSADHLGLGSSFVIIGVVVVGLNLLATALIRAPHARAN